VETQTNNLDPGRTVNYTYDALNRLTSGATQATSGADCWGQAVPSGGYDQYGNLSKINVSQCSAPALNLSVNAGNNQFNSGGFGYDLAGNMTGDGLYSYAWNGAGLLKSAAGVTYTYDGNGNRVEKSSGVFYWRGVDGNVLAETDTSGNPLNEYVFFAGGRIARVDASGNVYYYFQDMLGSDVAITNATGTLCYDADFYLFGGEKAPFTNTCAQNYKFTDMERDGETGLDHTLFRQYSSQYGRWMSPDPAGLGAASLANPQSWNMYSYVTNNPTTFTDPLGLDQCSDYLSSNQCQGVTGGVWSNGCDSFDPPWWCLCEEMGSGDCGPEPAISPIPWWPATPPPTPTVASLGEPSFGWPNGTSIYGGGGGPWSENPGISLNPHLTLNQLLGLPEPQQGCEFGPCEGVPGSTGNASGFQEIGSWNITHPSPQSCAKVKTVAVGGLVVGGGLLAAGALFPLIAPVTDLFGCPTAGVGAVFAVYYAAFCRSGQM
jgi:RHS repeat-associated protein